MWLVVVDTMQIQTYIFGSNRLRENVGASYLVDAATRDWALEAVKVAAPGKNNIGPGNDLRDGAWIENGLDAEVLYSGGGNFVALFSDIDKVKAFNFNLSRRALQEAPGLQLVIAQKEMTWREHVLRDKLDEVFRTLAVQKRNHTWSAPLLGLGVTASCSSTGLPATGVVPGIRGEPGYLASDEIRAKADVARPQQTNTSAADKRLQRTIKLAAEYSYPADFEDLGATAGEYSHIAVVHADGNGMGQRVREIGDKYATGDRNRDFVLELRKFSINVENAAKKALNAVLDRLKRTIDKSGGKSIVYDPNQDMLIQIELAKGKDSRYFIPFRPIVFGGDDVTFVCDGRLGLSLATAYLQEFEQYTVGLGRDGSGLTACAGVAIVKSHYPFARAYALAAELTRSAKSYRTKESIAGSCLDWHFALSGLSGSIKDIRDREYRVREGSLTLRPVTLSTNSRQGQHAWPVVLKGIAAFQQEEWAGRRNKVKALRDALREGSSAVEHFRLAFNTGDKLPQVLPEMLNWPLTGWQAGWCGYFDAIELVDWFIPLEGEVNATPAIVSMP
jgi:hypothetical protein